MKITRRDFLKASGVAAAAGVLAACSDGGSSSSGSDAGGSTGSSSSERPEWAMDADKVSGTLTVYTTMLQDEQDRIQEYFGQLYPDCTVQFQADSVGTLVTKVRSDSNSDCDVIAGGMFASDGTSNEDILQTYTTWQEENDQLTYVDDTHLKTYIDIQEMCIVVNPSLAEDAGVEIKGYNDLINDKLKGQIIVAAPDASSSGFRQLQTILAVMGDEFADDKAWDYIRKLVPLTFTTNSSKDVFNLVAQGEYICGLSYENAVLDLIADGADIECVYMEEGNTAMASGMSITKNSPNLTAAQALMDMLASKEHGDWRTTHIFGRSNNKYASTKGLKDADELGNVDLDLDYITEHKQELIDKYNEIVAELS
jgi:iron(III) transport system substrate-binding protein